MEEDAQEMFDIVNDHLEESKNKVDKKAQNQFHLLPLLNIIIIILS